MNELELIQALNRRLHEVFEGKTYANRKGDSVILSPVNIYNQYIPQTEGITLTAHGDSDEEDDVFMKTYPCVVIKAVERKDNEERSIVMSQITVKLIAGVYDESRINEGYADLMNMLIRMREDFYVNRFICQKFRVLIPLQTRMIESDTWPVSFGELELKFETGRKVAPHEYVENIGRYQGLWMNQPSAV